VTTGHPEPAVDAELVTVARNLYNAALDARQYVEAETQLINAGLGEPGRGNAPRILDALDAALADAGEALAGVTS
jgi:hypothetical protein